MMRIYISKKTLFKVFAFTLFFLLAPFAFELVIMADIIGVEAAIAFLFTYGKSVALALRDRVVTAFHVGSAFIRSEPSDVLLCHERPINAIAYTFVGFGLTGSFVVSVLNCVTLVSALA